MARVILHGFSTFKLGGPQARFVQLANALGPDYHHVVAAMDNCFEAGERLGPHVSWERLPLPNRRGGGLANRSTLRDVLLARKPDVLFSYNWGAMEWAAANLPKLVPQVHVEDGFGPEEAQSQLPRRVLMRRALLGWRPLPVVVASRNLQRIALDVWKLRARYVRFIPNGVVLHDVPPSATASPDPSAPLVVGTVAGLRPEKNIARLLRAFAALRARQAARLVIVGDGALRAELQQLATQLGVAADVEFAGYLAAPGTRLAQFDLFALSSDTEQLPIAMLEAMAAGVPVVATRVGDVPHILPESARAGLSEPDDASFCAALLGAVDARAEWPRWVEAGLSQVRQHYSEQVMVAQWRKLFDGRLDLVFDAPHLGVSSV
jgi:glycosyltransferase involved in cell wall biosynthesis